LLIGLLVAAAPAADAPRTDVTLAFEQLTALLAIGGEWPNEISPLAGLPGPLAGFKSEEDVAALRAAGLVADGGQLNAAGKALWTALVRPEATVQVQWFRDAAIGGVYYAMSGDELWTLVPKEEVQFQIEGPFPRGEASALVAGRVPLPTPTASADVAAELSLYQFMILQCLFREQAVFAAMLEAPDDGQGLTLDEMRAYLLIPSRLDALATEPTYDLLGNWEKIMKPESIRRNADALEAAGWIASTRSAFGVRYALSERGRLLARAVFSPPECLRVTCRRTREGSPAAASVQYCVAPEGITLVRHGRSPEEVVIAPLPVGDPRAAYEEALAALMRTAETPPATSQPAAVADEMAAPSGTLPGDEILDELQRGVFRTATAQQTDQLWNRGKPDTWRLDTNDDGQPDVEYEDTDGDDRPDFVRVRDLPDRAFTRSFICADDTWEESNILEAYLEVLFALPWARETYHRHNVNVVLNDHVVGQLTDTIPDGRYRFRIAPQFLRRDANSPQPNDVRLETTHLRGGHYVVSTDFRLILHLAEISQYVVAESQEEAQKILTERGNLITRGVDLSIYANEWCVDPPAPRDGQAVKLRGTVHNDGEETAEGWKLHVYVSEPAADREPIAVVELPAIPKGTATAAEASWTAQPGTHELFVQVVPPAEVPDLRDDNNRVKLVVLTGGDAEPPALIIGEPAENVTVTGPAVTIRGTATDNVGLARLEYSVDGGLWQSIAISERWEVTLELAAGAHCVRVRGGDTSGLEALATRNLTVR
jgi:hypothetical protein